MKRKRFTPRHAVRAAMLIFAPLLITPASHGTDLIDNDFGGGTDTGPAFQQLPNGLGTASADPATGTITTTGIDSPDHSPAPAKPNIVIIYADDLGFGDISRYGNLFGTPSASLTPNVDTLADQGVTFTQAHSANAVCTPSRYSLLTGIYNWRNFQGISGHYGYKGGLDNLSESIAGTDPNDPGSLFRIFSPEDTAAEFSVTWPSVAGKTYEVFWSTDLVTWTSDSTHPGTGGEMSVNLNKAEIDASDAVSGNLTSLFVRVGVF